MIDLLYLLVEHLGSLFPGYAITTMLLLIFSRCVVFLHKRRKTLLEAINITASFIGLLLAGVLITELIWHYYNDPGNGHIFFSYRFQVYTIPPILLIGTSILSLSPRIRRSIPATFVLIILFNAAGFIETVWIIITSFSRDYLPSSWSYYGSPMKKVILCLTLFLFADITNSLPNP
jgi:molybdopterin-containing oxidoreductase family membrane subunit